MERNDHRTRDTRARAGVEELIRNITYCQTHKDLLLFEYVIMPSHLHLICARNKGTLAEWLRDFKSFTAKRLLELIQTHPAESRSEWLLAHFRARGAKSAQNKEFAFWKKDNHPVQLFSSTVIEQKTDYIRMNPVMAGLVSLPEQYRWSSAHPEGLLSLNGYGTE